jgi:hypothetical protein
VRCGAMGGAASDAEIASAGFAGWLKGKCMLDSERLLGREPAGHSWRRSGAELAAA